MGKRPLSQQLAIVREAVKQFPRSDVRALSRCSLIPVAVLHRRLIELERFGLIAKDTDGAYHVTSLDFSANDSDGSMIWHPVNAMTFETATHRIRHVGAYWLAERKAVSGEPIQKIGTTFDSMEQAQIACDADAYSLASGR